MSSQRCDQTALLSRFPQIEEPYRIPPSRSLSTRLRRAMVTRSRLFLYGLVGSEVIHETICGGTEPKNGEKLSREIVSKGRKLGAAKK